VAALNHPNICQINDVGPNYLVLDYVEGSPIALVDSPRKLLDLAGQLSDGMAAAHAAEVVLMFTPGCAVIHALPVSRLSKLS
jgi:hypothetical protein